MMRSMREKGMEFSAYRRLFSVLSAQAQTPPSEKSSEQNTTNKADDSPIAGKEMHG
jgi:hypothetical protein